MTTRVKRIRIMDNNLAALTTGNVTASSELSSFPATNAYQEPFRSRQWKPSGRFTISSTNKTIYINDGSDLSADITEQDYTTPAALATEIQTQLNSVSSNWTVSYDSAGETFKFTISNSGSVTLRLSETTNAIWDTIGFTLTTNQTGTDFPAQEQRNHSSEEIVFDFGFRAPILFVGIIGALDEVFPISESAVVKFQASNLNQWDNPPLERTLTRLDGGMFEFFDDLTLTDSQATAFRFGRILIEDQKNPLGPEGLAIGHIFIGNYFTLTERNVTVGFLDTLNDPSSRQESESGALFFDERTKYRVWDNLSINYLARADKDDLKAIFNEFGINSPFYVSIDPIEEISDDLDEFTAYVVFDGPPKFRHVKLDTFNIQMKFREVL